jgi:hypothetical protein
MRLAFPAGASPSLIALIPRRESPTGLLSPPGEWATRR